MEFAAVIVAGRSSSVCVKLVVRFSPPTSSMVCVVRFALSKPPGSQRPSDRSLRMHARHHYTPVWPTRIVALEGGRRIRAREAGGRPVVRSRDRAIDSIDQRHVADASLGSEHTKCAGAAGADSGIVEPLADRGADRVARFVVRVVGLLDDDVVGDGGRLAVADADGVVPAVAGETQFTPL